MTRDGMPGLRTFLASFLVLFLEVALIRWMPAYIRLLAYFSNFILLASFLGIGVGCLLASSAHAPVPVVPGAAGGGDPGGLLLPPGDLRPDRRQHLFLERHVRQERRAGREHDAAAAAVRRRRGALRDDGAAHGEGDGGAAAVARLHTQHCRQPRRRSGVCGHFLAPAVASVVVRDRVHLGRPVARLDGARDRRRAASVYRRSDSRSPAVRRQPGAAGDLAGSRSGHGAGRDLVAVLQDHRRQRMAPTRWWR